MTMTDRKCSFPGCDHPLDAGGLCRGHRGMRDRGISPLRPLQGRGAGYQSITLRLRPETVQALRDYIADRPATITARQILEDATGTAK